MTLKRVYHGPYTILLVHISYSDYRLGDDMWHPKTGLWFIDHAMVIARCIYIYIYIYILYLAPNFMVRLVLKVKVMLAGKSKP